jgi:ketosteroid isomerase-like protein
MRSVLLGVPSGVLLASLVACVGAGIDLVAAEAEVRARSEQLIEAEVARDIDKTMAFFAPDIVMHFSGGPELRGHAAIRPLYEEVLGSDQLKELSASPIEVRVSHGGDLAYELGVNRLVLATPDGDMVDVGKYLAVWSKVGGEWLISAISFTSDASASVPART